MVETPDEDLFPIVIEERQNLWTPALLVGGCLLGALVCWNKFLYFYGFLGAAAIFSLYLFGGHRKVVIYAKKRELHLYTCRIWGENLEHVIPFGDVMDFKIRKSLGSGESSPDFHPHLVTRDGRYHALMMGINKDDDDAEHMISAVRKAVGMPET